MIQSGQPATDTELWQGVVDTPGLVTRCEPTQSSLLNPHNSEEGEYGPQEPELMAEWIASGAKLCADDPGCD